MSFRCPKCYKENLQQGTDNTILCNDCKKIFVLVEGWVMGLR